MVDTIVGFTILALSSISSAVQVVSPPVASAWLFVVRQLYKTGEGLSVLEFSDLHQHVARAWKTVSTHVCTCNDVFHRIGKEERISKLSMAVSLIQCVSHHSSFIHYFLPRHPCISSSPH